MARAEQVNDVVYILKKIETALQEIVPGRPGDLEGTEYIARTLVNHLPEIVNVLDDINTSLKDLTSAIQNKKLFR